MNKYFRINTLLCLNCFLLAASVQAAEWRIDPTLRFRTGYNNNITLTTQADKPSSAEISFQPNAKFSRNTEVSSISGTVGANLRRFPEENGLNDDNFNFTIDAFRGLQRNDFRLGLDFIKDTTLETELESTGLVFGRTDRSRQSINPDWTWRFNESTHLNANYTYSAVDYDANSQGYVDSRSHTAQLSLNRALNERSTISLIANQTLTKNDNNVLSRSTNLQLGYRYNLSETISASLSAGARKSTTKYSRDFFLAQVIPFTQQIKVDETGSVFSASVSKTVERGRHALNLSRDIQNSISGRLIEVTTAGSDNSYRFSDRLSAALNFDYYQSHSTSDVSTIENIDREYYTISPGLNWKLSRLWTISSNYHFKKQTSNNSEHSAIQNSFAINLTYQWPRIAISR